MAVLDLGGSLVLVPQRIPGSFEMEPLLRMQQSAILPNDLISQPSHKLPTSPARGEGGRHKIRSNSVVINSILAASAMGIRTTLTRLPTGSTRPKFHTQVSASGLAVSLSSVSHFLSLLSSRAFKLCSASNMWLQDLVGCPCCHSFPAIRGSRPRSFPPSHTFSI
jgi:hypothetical protein